MPRRSIDLLAAPSPFLHETQRLTSSMTPGPLFKLFTTYNNPWWLAAGYTDASGTYVPVQARRSVTDLPVRQTCYWPRSDGQPATQGRAMLLASCDDGTNIGVKSWEVKQQNIKPLPCPLYICYEACFDAQGWVEGALQTAGMMLKKMA